MGPGMRWGFRTPRTTSAPSSTQLRSVAAAAAAARRRRVTAYRPCSGSRFVVIVIGIVRKGATPSFGRRPSGDGAPAGLTAEEARPRCSNGQTRIALQHLSRTAAALHGVMPDHTITRRVTTNVPIVIVPHTHCTQARAKHIISPTNRATVHMSPDEAVQMRIAVRSIHCT
jgi:hypothetical protein